MSRGLWSRGRLILSQRRGKKRWIRERLRRPRLKLRRRKQRKMHSPKEELKMTKKKLQS